MADTKISALAAMDPMLDAAEFVVNDAGTSKKITGTVLKAWMGDAIQNQNTANQSIAAATTAYLAGSALAVPVGKLRIGTWFRWRFSVLKTAAGTAACTIGVRVGTAGTTADTSRIDFTTATGTAAVDTGIIVVDVICRGPLSASGIFAGTMQLTHDLDATGLQNKATRIHQLNSSAFDVTVANLIVGLSITTAASTVWNFEVLTSEAKNL